MKRKETLCLEVAVQEVVSDRISNLTWPKPGKKEKRNESYAGL